MILKKKQFFLLIFLILLQSCSGGRIGNFLESSFNDLEKISKDEEFQKNLINKKNLIEERKELDKYSEKKVERPKAVLENEKDKNLEKKVEKPKAILENEKDKNLEKKVEKPKAILENEKDKNLEKKQKQKNNKIKNSSKKRKIELQSYKIIFILKDVDPKDPTGELNTILRNSAVNFEIEKIERVLDLKNKSMNKN